MWPEYYPPNCPPDDADDASGDVFRLVRSAQPSSADFVPKILEEPGKDWAGKEWMACGLSVYRLETDIDQIRNQVPAFKRRLIAVATLEQSMGKTKLTGRPSHTTWWVPNAIEPAPLFTVRAGGAT